MFLDTNVFVAEALLGEATERAVRAALDARWRIYTSEYVLDELVRVLTTQLGCTTRFATLTRRRVLRHVTVVRTPSGRQRVADDPADGPIVNAALRCGDDLLITNDRHLLALHPLEGLRILRVAAFIELLEQEGLT